MSQDQKFQQQWEFRRRDDDLDSSSDESKSSSRDKPVLKKHKLVSNFILSGNDETSNTPLSQRESRIDPYMGTPFDFGKADKMHTEPRNKNHATKNKTKRGSMKKSNRKKNNQSKCQLISLDDFNIFVKSIIEELKVARESMFTRMREEMKKLAAIESDSRRKGKEGSSVQKIRRGLYKNNVELGMNTENCNGGSLERSVKCDTATVLNNCYEVLKEQTDLDQSIGTITPNEKEKVESMEPSVKKRMHSSNHSHQVVSSPYLTLPTVLPEPRAENQRIDSSFNNVQPGAAGKKIVVNLEKAKSLIDASAAHRGCFSGIQQAEQFGSFSQMGSQSMGYFDQYNTQTSTMGIGFPVPLHHGLGNGFNIPSQSQGNSSRGNNFLGLRVNGGAIRFAGGNEALSEHIVASNFHSQVNYKTDAGLLAFGNQDVKDGQR